MTNYEVFSQLLDKIRSFDYIHADQIPNIDLYMDQVTTFMDTHLGATTVSYTHLDVYKRQLIS